MSADDAAVRPARSSAGARGAWTRVAWAVAAVLGVLLVLVVAGMAALAGGGGAALLRPVLEAKLGRRVTYAHLAVTRAPEGIRLQFTDLRLGQPKRFGPGDLARVPHADLVVRLAPLLAGRLEAPTVTLDSPELHLVRRGPGDDNYSFGHGGGSGVLGATRVLRIAGGRVTMVDPQRRLTLQATLAHDAAGALPLRLEGGGVLQGEPYLVHARGGPLNGRKPHSPHAVQVELHDGAVRLSLSGETQAPFDFRGLDMDVQAQGPNLADLVYLFNLLAPNSPPFRLTGHMHRQDKRFSLTRLQATLGDSDLEGDISSVHLARRRLDARLRSRRLMAKDLRVLLASPPPHASTRAVAGVAGHGGGTATRGRVLSSTPVSLHRLQGEDVTLRYHADRADGFGPAASDVGLDLAIQSGRLTVAPLSFGVAGGAVRIDYALDTTSKAFPAHLAARVRGVQLARVAAGGGFGGRLDADVDVRGAGPSVARQAATADGRASLRVTGGSVPKKDAAALSGDMLGLVGALLSPKGRAPLHCATADFTLASGMATATRLVVSTDGGRATGGGRIDLRDERLALHLEASSQAGGPPVQLRVPIVVDGSLARPHVTGKAPTASAGVSDLFRSLKHLVGPRPTAPPPGC